MKCPKCAAAMQEVVVRHDGKATNVDRCAACNGLWFDHGEAEALGNAWAAEFLDIGDPADGARHDENDTVGCPRCGVVMKHYFVLEAALQYEHCDDHGRFFDAGEFTRWAEQHYL